MISAVKQTLLDKLITSLGTAVDHYLSLCLCKRILGINEVKTYSNFYKSFNDTWYEKLSVKSWLLRQQNGLD
jgi:hypothetical protein